jgi:hypothetical protein
MTKHTVKILGATRTAQVASTTDIKFVLFIFLFYDTSVYSNVDTSDGQSSNLISVN